MRVLIGIVGALTPVAGLAATVDPVTVFADPAPAVLAGYLLRILGLCVVGGVAGYFASEFAHRHDIWQIGIAAPVTIVMLGSTGAISEHAAEKMAAMLRPTVLHAQGIAQAGAPRRLEVAVEDQASQFVRGLLGRRIAAKDWLVVLGEFESRSRAEVSVSLFRRQFPQLEFVWYEPAPDLAVAGWLVTLGGQQTQDEAATTAEQAGKLGLNRLSLRRLVVAK